MLDSLLHAGDPPVGQLGLVGDAVGQSGLYDKAGQVDKVLELDNQVAALDSVERPLVLAHRVPRSADLRREIDISTWA